MLPDKVKVLPERSKCYHVVILFVISTLIIINIIIILISISVAMKTLAGVSPAYNHSDIL